MIGLQAHAFVHSDIVAKKSKQTIQKMFGSEVNLVAFESNLNYYSIYQQDFHCLLLHWTSPSKHDVFEFMVVYDPLLHIQKYKCLFTEKITVTRSSKRWLTAN